MNIINRFSKFLIIIFIVYLTLAPTPIVGAGLMRFFPTLTLLLILFFGICGFRARRFAKMGTIVSVFLIYIIFSAIIHQPSEGSKIMTLLKSSYWCWIYLIAFALFMQNYIKDKQRDLVIVLTTVLFVFSFNYSHISRLIEFDLVGDNAVFYPLLMVPWIACISNMTKRWVMLALVALCAISALKRSGIIIISASAFLLYYGDFIHRQRLHLKTILMALFVIAGMFAIVEYKADSISDLGHRFDLIKEDGGSGRDGIYEDVYNRYISSSIEKQILGHGFDGVRRDSSYIVPVSAHNDFLEVLYDFGLIGFLLYVLIHFSLIKWTIHLFRARSRLAFPVLISYVCFLVMSIVSHLVLYPTCFGLLVAFWAYAECKDKELQY